MMFRSVLACALHETGHWATVKILGGNVCSLRLTAVGAEMELDSRCPLSYGRETAAALAGPLVNLLTAWVSALNEWYLFAGLNLCFGILNLLPVYPLDGGRALACVLASCCPGHADAVLRVISILFSGAFLGLGWAAWRGWGNLNLFCVAMWLLAGTLKRCK